VIDERDVFEKSFRRYEPERGSFERLARRRDRKCRNQRITAGVAGIAAFVAAVWIVTSVASLDRGEKSVVPAGTGPVQTGPAVTGTGGFYREDFSGLPPEGAVASRMDGEIAMERRGG
jgi:hypothetical protein